MSRMPKTYLPPTGGPLYWADDVTGELPAAVKAFIAHGLDNANPMTPEQVELVRDYCEYYINAPCWETEGMEATFASLRERVKSLKSAKDIADWIYDGFKVGIDPL